MFPRIYLWNSASHFAKSLGIDVCACKFCDGSGTYLVEI
jgi:hypothetical protein